MKQIEQRAPAVADGPEAPAVPEVGLVQAPAQGARVASPDVAPAHWLDAPNSTLTAIDRLKATIDEETEKLEIRAMVDFDGFSQRKNRGLLELTRAMRLTQDPRSDPRVVPQLTQLRASLIRNQAALQIHLDAVREVSAIIARSIQEVESDGTYSLTTAGKRK